MSVRDRLETVFAKSLELKEGVDFAALRQREHDEWDSVGHMSLVVAIEEEFAVDLEPEQMVGIDSFEAALRMLREFGIDDD
ncbi:acyl carrier protein [Plantactinospora sp. KLBMP9567]|uniref:acyl carrier protein n=1 Tax=Plantactinospora sp. KLBMP9567 TaxID=3085900 RepID=UPI0029815218|nr:acyl carrier protein [Plantactinospora sp. KLBMP9567]MDW5330237.1 acyl carrier protein [Plantactinospora sp. KLBMP9567]